jgi:hypothetical protein
MHKSICGETMKHIKTDSDLVQIAKQIDKHLNAIRHLTYDLEGAEHPLADTFIQELDQNGLTAFAWAQHLVSHCLIYPERWETGDYGIRFKRKVRTP